ncbi:hypothetical protein AWC14_16015 [Mycobacterium kyorinense]|uniref:UsfY protein n=1 Tax=Mycobacterium kyorinense TaxID=487514 RepID=A0A1X1XDI7_9MYCO|nr:hypothetical protein AWC14_16015 [Mycobacterium kyorinense]
MLQLSRSDKLRFAISMVVALVSAGGAITAVADGNWGSVVVLGIACAGALFAALGTLSKNPKIYRLVSNEWLIRAWRQNNERWHNEERQSSR